MKSAILWSGVALATFLSGTTTAGAAELQVVSAELSAVESAEIETFVWENPLDLAGLEGLVLKFTGEKLQVSLNGVDGPLTGVEAQHVMDQRNERWQREGRAAPGGASTTAIPSDAFSVGVTWIPVYGPPPRVKAHGFWNFRDNYIGGTNPDDFSSVSLQLGCSRIVSTTTLTYNYQNQQTANGAYLYDPGLSTSAPVSAVRDRVSGFAMTTDHGFTDVLIENPAGCGSHNVGAAYIYEHNQGGSPISVSAGFGLLSISYAGGAQRMQRATNPTYRWL